MKIEYTKCEDYNLPNLKLTEKKYKQLNKYGLLRLEYLKNSKPTLYQELLIKDKLYEHLFSVSIEANNKINTLIEELVKKDNTINERLKEKNQILWVQKMNQCKSIAEEFILKEYVYGEIL